MPLNIGEVIKYLEEFKVKEKKPRKRLGDILLGTFKGAIPRGATSTDLVKELRKPRYG